MRSKKWDLCIMMIICGYYFYMQSSKNSYILFGYQTEISMKNKDT